MSVYQINGGVADQPGTPVFRAGPACPVGFFEAAIEERDRVVDGGGISIVVIDGAAMERTTTGTFATDYVPQIDKKVYFQDFEVSVTLSVTDSAMAIEDGVAKSLQNGSVRNLIISTPQVTRSFPVTPKVENVTTPIDTFSHWNSGTFARFNVDRVGELTDGLSANDATRKLFVGATRERNPQCFAAPYVQDLTAIASATSRYGNHIGLTAITKRHLVGVNHVKYNAGDTVTFTAVDGSQIVRTIVARKSLIGEGLDIIVYLIDEDLPEDIRPSLLLPEDVHLYQPYFGNLPSDYTTYPYRVPAIFADRDQKLNIGNLITLPEQPGATSRIVPYPEWYFTPQSGTSGKPVMLMVSPNRLALAVIQTASGGGVSVHSRDWETIIEDLDEILEISTGYIPARADLSLFTYFS